MLIHFDYTLKLTSFLRKPQPKFIMQYTLISVAIIAASTFVSAIPMPQGGAFASQSVPLAINLNKSFNGLTATSSRNPATQANVCIKGAFAQCVGGKFLGCGNALKCFALPLVNSVGTSVTCDTRRTLPLEWESA